MPTDILQMLMMNQEFNGEITNVKTQSEEKYLKLKVSYSISKGFHIKRFEWCTWTSKWIYKNTMWHVYGDEGCHYTVSSFERYFKKLQIQFEDLSFNITEICNKDMKKTKDTHCLPYFEDGSWTEF